jgi:hypothetical protein
VLSVTTAAADLTLLSIAEMRAAANLTDGSRDTELRTIAAYTAAVITKACRVSTDGAAPPTLRLESLSDTYRLKSSQNCLILSRVPVVELTTVTENDVELDPATDYEVEASSGLLYRLSGDARICWPCGVIVVEYDAGWETVPDDLKYAAIKFIKAGLQQDDRDPLLKRKVTQGVSEYEWWVDPTKESVIPGEVMDILERGGYVNTWIG